MALSGRRSVALMAPGEAIGGAHRSSRGAVRLSAGGAVWLSVGGAIGSWPRASSRPAQPWKPAKDISELPLDTHPNDSAELASFRKEHNITTAGDCPAPFLSFDECSWIPAGPRQAITAAGFDKPSAIQAFSWKAGLEGRDVVGVAKTGA